jgi:hypothetical protein
MQGACVLFAWAAEWFSSKSQMKRAYIKIHCENTYGRFVFIPVVSLEEGWGKRTNCVLVILLETLDFHFAQAHSCLQASYVTVSPQARYINKQVIRDNRGKSVLTVAVIYWFIQGCQKDRPQFPWFEGRFRWLALSSIYTCLEFLKMSSMYRHMLKPFIPSQNNVGFIVIL